MYAPGVGLARPAVPAFLRLPLAKLAAAGVDVREGPDGFVVRGTGELVATDVATLPFPGCPTDLQALFVVLLSQAQGTSMVTANVYDGRCGIVPQLRSLGAEIQLERGPSARSARVSDPARAAAALSALTGADVHVTGFALGQPSLDEVFFTLTGRTSTAENPLEVLA